MITKTKLKSWGSSLGVVVPRTVVQEEHLQEGNEVLIDIRRLDSLQDIFGSLKEWKIDTQKMKDELREEWQ